MVSGVVGMDMSCSMVIDFLALLALDSLTHASEMMGREGSLEVDILRIQSIVLPMLGVQYIVGEELMGQQTHWVSKG
jgi:hypothetical protein